MSVNNFPMFRDKPLVRSGDTLYFGSMKESHVIKIDIKSKKKVGDLEVADKVGIQMIATDPSLSLKDKIVKSSEKNGLYAALDVADVWLSRIIGEKTEEKTGKTEEKSE